MNNTKKSILALVAAGLVPSVCFAAVNTLNDIVTNAAASLTLLGAGLATISFIIAGIMFLSATGNPGRMGIAKSALIAAVVGIVIVVLAGSAQAFVKTFFGF